MLVLSGPFWICTTLVFAIAISGNISSFLVHLGKPNYKYTPEFRKGKCCYPVVFTAHLFRLNVRGKCTFFETFLFFELTVFSSDHSCNSDLQLCLVGASCPLGFPALEKQQDHEPSVIFLFGDRLCVWIFPCDLHSSSGKI